MSVILPPPEYLSLLNIGPPFFQNALNGIELIAGHNTTIEIPKIMDPDQDNATITFSLGPSIRFITLSPLKDKLTVSPGLTDAG